MISGSTKMVTAALLLSVAAMAQAALVNRGSGMIYDTTSNITWLADLNFARTSGYTSIGANGSGMMTWNTATTWADSLVYAGFSDWRLPTLNRLDTTCSSSFDYGGTIGRQYFGTGCSGGELSNLFVSELGNLANESVLISIGDTAQQIENVTLFSNMQVGGYWSSTRSATAASNVFRFGTNSGIQDTRSDGILQYAVAVRSGDVPNMVPSNIPEPGSLPMVALALGLFLGVNRLRSA